ncbi:hypothetical protein [Luteococcus japonicus]|uniref:hypothetical protein n=1 Tax=Luteococcus japonicus TaxID=33984 RepID=UPI0011814BDD|nr:hypothetical protein [Luteococcus japonicus]
MSTFKRPDGSIPWEISAHGYWKRGTCPQDAKANVTVRLYEWHENAQKRGFWKEMGSNRQETFPRENKKNKDVLVRLGCKTNKKVSWINQVETDVVGYADPPTVSRTQATVGCSV